MLAITLIEIPPETKRKARPRGVKRFLRNNGLGLALAALTCGSLVGHLAAGMRVERAEARARGEDGPAGLLDYAGSGHFLESLFENWESEFLQMAAYVLLTVFLFQRGSAESKDPESDAPDPCEADPRAHARDPHAPWPVRRRGLALTLYSHSLSIALASLFAVSFTSHAVAGLGPFNDERSERGQAAASLGDYLTSAEFWFESFQNWQSEFLSVGALVALSIFLRQRGSPESKPVHAPHGATGKQ